ncbi:major facilitator superfamily domain-containing protein 6-A-like [Dermatophagoides pteronyssinus]|uniref:major facilitator superfamily domain-containing protein 6-A-like n=1 Tax=Dermatophagoides pteronyssinus TaxID=6956 RepID=UPI003F67F7B7
MWIIFFFLLFVKLKIPLKKMQSNWPLKAHYLFWFGSLSGILPFVSIFAREHLQISAESVGILFFILPFIVSIIKPLICSIGDRYNCHSIILIISQISTILGYGLLLLIPWLLQWITTEILWWIFCLLTLIANTAMGSGISLTDYLVINEVEQLKSFKQNISYGSYRIWGTVGYGIFGILSGVINDHPGHLPYLIPGLIMFVAIESLDLFTIWQFYHRRTVMKPDLNPESGTTTTTTVTNSNEEKSTGIFWSVLEIFIQIIRLFRQYPTLIQHSLNIFIFGILTAFHWSFFFWYLEDLRGKDALLMGLCLFVESFLGEIPIFYFAHFIIEYFGSIWSLCLALAAFALRYIAYGYWLEQNNGLYWDILLVEILQGLTFSLFYSVMTYVANYYADKCDKFNNQNDVNDQKQQQQQRQMIKPSATMQALMSACYEGIGLGIGSLFGGYITQNYGIRTIWRIGAFISIGLIGLNILIELIKMNRKKK